MIFVQRDSGLDALLEAPTPSYDKSTVLRWT